MMAGFLLCVSALMGVFDFTDYGALEYLKQHGYGETHEEYMRAINDAFDHEDSQLLFASTRYLLSIKYMDKYVQLVLDRYHECSKSKFCSSNSLSIGYVVSQVPRMAKSKYGYEMYQLAINEIHLKSDADIKSLFCIDNLSDHIALSLEAYYIKVLLKHNPKTAPDSYILDMIMYRNLYDKISPIAAYFICERFKGNSSFDEEFKAIYENIAQPILKDPNFPPDKKALENLMSSLDAQIAEDDRKYREKYGNIDPAPYTPPPPKPPATEMLDGVI